MEKITKGHPLSQSPDMAKQNIETLKQLFPTIVKEGKIDMEELKALLGEEIETGDEYYRFTWAGKSQARREANKPSTATLRPCKEESKNWDTTNNIFIEGDNLEVLKLLQKSYAGKIKMIYIDPPYNTGKEFVYKDNYTDNLGNYLELTGQKDESGKTFGTNTESDGRYHSNWLNMMYSRLKLAFNLLKEDGVIFISIDDSELYNLKSICDEIFGMNQFVLNIVVNRASEIASNNTVSKHEYILVYCRSSIFFKVNGIPKYSISRGTVGNADQTMPVIEFPAGLSCKGVDDGTYHVTRKIKGSSENIENLDPIEIKNSKLAKPVRLKAKWRSSNDMRNFFNNNCKPTEAKISGLIEDIYFNGDRFVPQIKKLTFEKLSSIIETNRRGSIDLEKIQLDSCFDFPKSVGLLKSLIKLIKTEKSDLILDFFAGSATLAQSIIELNSDDNNQRNYLLVQLPEPFSNGSVPFKKGFSNISELAKERIRRAGDKILNEKKDELKKLKKSTEGKMHQEEVQGEIDRLQQKVDKLDIGFKVFKLDNSNIQAWDGNVESFDEQSLLDTLNNIKTDRTEADVLYEVLLKYGLDLTVPIEEKQEGACTIYSVGGGVLFACLSDKITTEVAKAIGKWKNERQPVSCRVLFKDTGFSDDVAKTNSIQILRQFGIEEVNSI